MTKRSTAAPQDHGDYGDFSVGELRAMAGLSPAKGDLDFQYDNGLSNVLVPISKALAGTDTSAPAKGESTSSKGKHSLHEGEAATPIERGYVPRVKKAQKSLGTALEAVEAAEKELKTIAKSKPATKAGWANPEDEAERIRLHVSGLAGGVERAVSDLDALIERISG